MRDLFEAGVSRGSVRRVRVTRGASYRVTSSRVSDMVTGELRADALRRDSRA